MGMLYLITGFLGAGKTTFLTNFIRLFAGQKIQLIIMNSDRRASTASSSLILGRI